MSDQLLIEIRVRPNSSQNKVGGVVGDPPRLVVAVQAPAVDGKANDAVVKELAKAFDCRARDFTIVYGELGRDKRLLITGDVAALEKKYLELQQTTTLQQRLDLWITPAEITEHLHWVNRATTSKQSVSKVLTVLTL